MFRSVRSEMFIAHRVQIDVAPEERNVLCAIQPHAPTERSRTCGSSGAALVFLAGVYRHHAPNGAKQNMRLLRSRPQNIRLLRTKIPSRIWYYRCVNASRFAPLGAKCL